MSSLQNVIDYWFEKKNDYEKWFMSGKKLDKFIISNYKQLLDYYRDNNTPIPKLLNDKLALIILLDQFSRHIYRDDPRSFDMDDKAKSITLQLLESGGINLLDNNKQMFALMPLQHSENLKDIDLLLDYLNRQPGDNFNIFIDYSNQHREVIKKFGRYPKRNHILARESTPEELQYIRDTPNKSF